MKFLIDAQLPRTLGDFLNQKGHDARHVLELPAGERTPDVEIWKVASQHDEIIVSKDSDFFYRSQVLGPPPQVIHLVFGNCTNKRLMELLELHWHSIEVALQVPARLIVVGKDSMKIWI